MTEAITRRQAARVLGITDQAMKDAVHIYRSLGWPLAVRKAKNTQYHIKSDVVAWWERVKAHKAENSIDLEQKTKGLDNAMATEWLRKPSVKELSFGDIVARHTRKSGKTVCVRLVERNDRENPHSGLTKTYNGCNDHHINMIGRERW